MAGKRDKPEEIVSKLRQVEVLQGQPMVDLQVPEHGAALRGADPNPRSRRLTKCAKDLDTTNPLDFPREPSMDVQNQVRSSSKTSSATDTLCHPPECGFGVVQASDRPMPQPRRLS